MNKAVKTMGPKTDLEWQKKIVSGLHTFYIDTVLRIPSAHKFSLQGYDIFKDHEKMQSITCACWLWKVK
jgi:phosphoribosylcarboxyaminoimidazole (NCAIR) mutase